MVIEKKVILCVFLLLCCLKGFQGKKIMPRPNQGPRTATNPVFLIGDYGGVAVRKSDCDPLGGQDPPKFVFPNSTSARDSYYFSLTCIARYPITVDFDGNKPFMVNARLMMANTSPGDKNLSSVCYIAHLSRYLYQGWLSPVGNFTCRSMADPNKSKSFYYFRPDSIRQNNVFNVPSGSTTVFVNQNKVSGFTIPCPSVKSNIRNSVLKKEAPITAEQVNLDKFDGFKVKYDKFKGFLVTYKKPKPPATTTTPQPTEAPPTNVTTRRPRPSRPTRPPKPQTPVTGRYVCVDPKSFGSANIDVKHADFLAYPNRTNLTFDNGRITLECYSSSQVSLVVLQGSKPSSWSETSETPRNLKNYGYSYGVKTTYRTTDPTAKGSIACVDSSSKKPLFQWNFDNNYICKCEWNNTSDQNYNYYPGYYNPQREEEYGESDNTTKKRRRSDWRYFEPPYFRGEMTCSNSKASVVDFSLLPCDNPIDCQFTQQSCQKDTSGNCESLKRNYQYRYGYNSRSSQSNTSTYTMTLRPGNLECTADGYVSKFQVTTDFKGEMYFNDQRPNELVHIEAPETHVFTGDQMIFSCQAASGILTYPVVWAFQFNDPSNFFNYSFYSYDNSHYALIDHMPLYTASSGVMRTTYLTIPEKKGASKLWCFVPKWNSTEWASTSINLDVEDAEIAQNPPLCPKTSKPFIVMHRNSTYWPNRIRRPHRVDGKEAYVFDPVESVNLYCFSKYPVVWKKDGMNISSRRTSRGNCRRDNGDIMKHYLYKNTVTFQVDSFNSTGNYTCTFSSSNLAGRQASTYIYAMRHDNRTTFVDEGKHHVISVKWDNSSKDWNDKKWVVVPCRLNTPKITPYLFIDLPEQGRVQMVRPHPNYLKFDPKLGFLLDITSSLIKGKETTFFCSDHKDGSLIGMLVTLELTYDKPNIPTNTPLTIGTTSRTPTSGTKSTMTTTPRPSGTIRSDASTQSSGGNAGLIAGVILLCILCAGCSAISFFLYRRVRGYESKGAASHELDWTRRVSNPNHNNLNGSVSTLPESTNAEVIASITPIEVEQNHPPHPTPQAEVKVDHGFPTDEDFVNVFESLKNEPTSIESNNNSNNSNNDSVLSTPVGKDFTYQRF